jgi:hypothetical protein
MLVVIMASNEQHLVLLFALLITSGSTQRTGDVAVNMARPRAERILRSVYEGTKHKSQSIFRWVIPVVFNIVRGPFQKFCTLYVFSLKMNLFYKIHLQSCNVISIVLYHSGPSFGKVLYSCLVAFVVDASDYSCHLIRHLPNASEAFPTEWFLQFWEQVKVWWAEPTRLWLVSNKVTWG